MKPAIVFLLWASVMYAYGQAAPASSNHASDEQAIRKLNGEVLKAHNLGDVKLSIASRIPTFPNR